jgi:hypothetical protein
MSIFFLKYKYKEMWEIILIILASVIILYGATSNYQQIGGGDSSLYYSQHRYPAGSWWIPFYDPSQHCHKKARVRCQRDYFYDDCYKQTIRECNDYLKQRGIRLHPTDMLAWGDAQM